MQKYVDGLAKPCQRNDGPKSTWLCLAVAVSRRENVVPELRRTVSSLCSGFDEDSDKALSGLIGFIATLPVWGCELIFPSSFILHSMLRIY